MGLNVSNMPMNKLYKFAEGSYVWSTMLKETREGNYPSNQPSKFTEVYRIDGNGILTRVASGRLVDNPSINDFDKRFSISDYDQDYILSFFVEQPLEEANLEELYKLRDAIATGYKNRK